MQAPPVLTRHCAICGLAVGTYEPSFFVNGSDVVRGSRASEPELATTPGWYLLHEQCFLGSGPEPVLEGIERAAG